MDAIQETFEGFINQTLYATELDLSREVLNDLDWAAKVYGIKRSLVADSILKTAFREYRDIISAHENQLNREDQQ
ncbi:MAG TPA: hypothetical protein VHQ46_00495 [Desulfobacteria bacterium]|nr:hypothetical protein [Desulfobacteria bacterium]